MKYLLSDGTKCYITKYFNSVPLITDELKTLFGIDKVGRSRCLYGGVKAILHKHYSEEYQFDSLIFNDLDDEVRRCFIFRWFLGLTMSSERDLMVRRYKSGITRVTSNNDRKHNFLSTKQYYGSDLSSKVLDRWFTTQDLILLSKKMLTNYDSITIRQKIYQVINRIDPEEIVWGHCIYGRVTQFIENI